MQPLRLSANDLFKSMQHYANSASPLHDPLLHTLHTALSELKAQHAKKLQREVADTPAVTVGFSGGADSMALLHAASRLRDHQLLHLRALHINHGLHADCQQWQTLASQQCQQLKVPLTVVSVQVDRRHTSLETAARQARYQAFEAHLQQGEVLLLAHHQRDQAETVLLHLLRGSGAAGLSGMPVSRSLGTAGACLLRPWLYCAAETLRQYCQQHQLSFVEDSSNLDPQHDRGWLRSELLPLLEQRKPGAIANIARSARLLLHNRQLANRQLQQLLQALLHDSHSVAVPALLQIEDPLLQHDLLRHWLRSLQLQPPPRQQLQSLLEQLGSAAQDRQPTLQQTDYTLQRHQQWLHVLPNSTAPSVPIQWQLPQRWQHAHFGSLELRSVCTDEVKLSNVASAWPTLTITARTGGERIRLPGGHHHKVKKLLQQSAIPHWQRSRLPLLWHRARLVAVADQFVCPALLRWLQQRHLQLHWQAPDFNHAPEQPGLTEQADAAHD